MLTWDYWPGPEGGAERQCRGLIRCLASLGVESEVWASGLAGSTSVLGRDERANVRRLGAWCARAKAFDAWLDACVSRVWKKNERVRHVVKFWGGLPLRWIARRSFIQAVFRLADELETIPDIVHVHETGWLAGVGVELANDWGVPIVCKVRNTPALEAIGYDVPMRKRWTSLRQDAHFVALHDALADELRAAHIPDTRISIVPNGTDVPESVMSEDRAPFTVLYVGNFSQGASHKGFDVLIEAWGKVYKAAPQARLLLAGGGDVRPWETMADACACRATIEFLGHVPDPSPLYERAGVFILPSRHEGMSNALLEAQAHGLPAVASDIPANRAVIVDGETGVLVPVDDSTALASATVRLLDDEAERNRMGNNAYAHARTSFDRMAVARNMLLLYQRLQKSVSV